MRRYLVLALLVLACGGSDTTKESSPPPAWQVEKGGTFSFAEVVSQAMDCPVFSITWTTTGGVISPLGIYTAPDCGPGVPGRFRIDAAGCGKTAFAEVDVIDTVITEIQVCIPFSMMNVGGQQQVFAKKTFQCPGHFEWDPFPPLPGYCF